MALVLLSVVVLLAAIVARYFFKKQSYFLWLRIRYHVLFSYAGFYGMAEDFLHKRENNSYDPPDATGCVAVITGGSRGIGAEIVKALLARNAHVIVGCRNVSAADKLLNSIRNEGIKSGHLDAYPLDVSSLNSVHSFNTTIKEKYSKINLLINNAGIMYVPYKETEDGFESQFATNYLGHFYLTHLLLSLLEAGGLDGRPSRVVNVSSVIHLVGDIDLADINHKENYLWSIVYSQSKLAQILFTYYLNRKLLIDKANVRVYAVHPGIVNTDLFLGTNVSMSEKFMEYVFKTPEEGSKPILYASLAQELEKESGSYISNCRIVSSKKLSYSTELQKRLFEFTNNLLNIKEFGKE